MSSQKAKAGHSKSTTSSGLLRLKLEFPVQCPEAGSNKLLLKKVDYRSKVSKIIVRIEQEVGILPDMYYLSYLDSIPMEESSRLSDHDVVNRATLRVNVWRMWQELLKAATTGNVKDCFTCSVNIAGSSEWSKYCAWVVLYIAAHHGHHNLVAELLKKTSLSINYRSPCGWTALHAAARMGRWKALCMLLDNGADVRIIDDKGTTAHDLCRTHGHKKCENSLSFCQWNLQKYRIVKERKMDYNASHDRQLSTRLAHQMVDSSLQMGFSGTQGQIYRVHTPNPVTVAMVNKFKEERASNPFVKEQLHVKIEEDLTCHDNDGKLDFNYGWFDEVRAQQLVPSTRDIVRYSDPSSCQLRPRSLLNPEGYRTQLYTSPPPPRQHSRSTLTDESTSNRLLIPHLPQGTQTGSRLHQSHLGQSWPIQRSSIHCTRKVGGATAEFDLRT